MTFPQSSPDKFDEPSGNHCIMISAPDRDFFGKSRSKDVTIHKSVNLAQLIIDKTDFNVVFDFDLDRLPYLARIFNRCRQDSRKIQTAAISFVEHRVAFVEDGRSTTVSCAVDFFIAGNFWAIIRGIVAGFKVIQIGEAEIENENFVQYFPDADTLIDQLAQDRVRGRLTLEEYGEFKAFVDARLTGGGKREIRRAIAAVVPRFAWHEFGLTPSRPASLWRTIVGVARTPFAAIRLLHGAGCPPPVPSLLSAQHRAEASNMPLRAAGDQMMTECHDDPLRRR